MRPRALNPILSLALLALSWMPAPAETGSPVSDIIVTYEFGVQIEVRGRLASGYAGRALAIQLTFSDESPSLVADLQPDAAGAFTYVLPIADHFVQAFSTVGFQFLLTAPDGSIETGESFSFFYTDNRFPWQQLDAPPFAVHWYAGDAEYARRILDAARAGWDQASRLLEVEGGRPIDIYAYAALEDYQFTRGQLGQLWAGGHANPASGLVIVSLPPGPEAGIEIERKIPHEVAHIALYQAAGSGFWNLPVWLNEGFASMLETFPNPDYDYLVAAAVKAGELIPLEELCATFPQDAPGALLAYAESTLATRYIRDAYGPAGLRSLVASYASGAACTRGPLAEPIGMPLAGLDAAWRDGIGFATGVETPEPPPPASDLVPRLFIFAAILLAPGIVLAGAGLRRRGRHA